MQKLQKLHINTTYMIIIIPMKMLIQEMPLYRQMLYTRAKVIL